LKWALHRILAQSRFSLEHAGQVETHRPGQRDNEREKADVLKPAHQIVNEE